jgi:hypothetical protein
MMASFNHRRDLVTALALKIDGINPFHEFRLPMSEVGQIRPKGEVIVKILLSIAAIAAVMLDGAGAAAAELPTFELMGFPITRHQVAVLGAAHVQERSPTPTLTLGDMPASPHQVRVLTPRIPDGHQAANLSKPGFSAP